MQRGPSARASSRRLRTKLVCTVAAIAMGAFVPALAGAHASSHRRDADNDGLTNRFERKVSHTNPRRADTDRDKLSDRYEVRRSHTNPRRKDTDRDGLSDRFEVRRSHTNPRRKDTDKDGMNDGAELRVHRNPLVPEYPQIALPLGAPLPSVPQPGGGGDTPAPADPTPNPLAPDTTIGSGPSGTSDRDAATFTFSSSQLLSTFTCRLDGSAWAACTSPKSYDGLADGSHTFEVAASNVFGLTDASPASRTWTVDVAPPPDTVPPLTSISSGPSGTTTSASATFAFISTEAGSTFKCRLDGSAWAACTSPKAYSGLADGSHTFEVAATDAAGNTDASPASRTWTIDTSTPPPPDGESNCMPDPSACGFPDVENTGTLAGVARTAVSGAVRLSTPGQVYENKTVTGSIEVTAANVTIRNVRLIATDDAYGIRSFGNSGAKNLLVQDSEIDMNGKLGTKGIAFDGYTLQRVFMHNGSDCAHFGRDVVIEDSVCTIGPDTNGDAWPDSTGFCSGPDHFDGFQTNGGRNLVIRHNTIRNPCGQTSDIAIFDDQGATSDTTVDHNLLAGGGYTVDCPADHGFVATMRVTNNRFARTWFSRSGQYGPTRTCDYAGQVSGNVWDDTGAAVN